MALPRSTSQDHFPPPLRAADPAIGGYRSSIQVIKPPKTWAPTPHREPISTVAQNAYVAHPTPRTQRQVAAPSGLRHPPIFDSEVDYRRGVHNESSRRTHRTGHRYETPRSTTAEAYATAG